jgi:NarL family two-component system response regulator LiaR
MSKGYGGAPAATPASRGEVRLALGTVLLLASWLGPPGRVLATRHPGTLEDRSLGYPRRTGSKSAEWRPGVSGKEENTGIEGRVRVMIVDDHAVVRSGLSAFLLAYDDLDYVGEAAGGAEAVQKCAALKPDVILMDLVMPGMDGAESTRRIKETCPDVAVIALTSYKEDDLVQNALKAGAISYLLKNVSADELANAIREAHAGRPTLAPEAAQVLIKAATGPAEEGLTSRELEILRLMVHGDSNPDIAEKLFVSRSTVKFHVSNILMKLGAATRTEAVAMAVQRRLVE